MKLDTRSKTPPGHTKLNEWGVPDGKDSAYYRRYNRASLRQSRWEVLRRQDIYRSHWAAELADVASQGRIKRSSSGPAVSPFSPRAELYGLEHLVDPAWSIFNDPNYKTISDKYTPVINALPAIVTPLDVPEFIDGLEGRNPDARQRLRDLLTRAQDYGLLLVPFDLFMPDQPQFDRIKKEKKGWAAEIANRQRAESAWTSNLALYLRVMDLRQSGLSVRRMADALSGETKTYEESEVRRLLKAAAEFARIHTGLDLSRTG